MGEVKRINKQINEKYGLLPDMRPRFRVVWSSDQTEKREGMFCDWYGHVLIRRVYEVREVLKYPFKDDRDRWVLETMIFTPSFDLKDSENGHYEPLYVFKTNDGKYLKPVWKAVDFMLHCLLYGHKRTVEERFQADRDQFEREIQEIKEYLDDKTPYLADKLKRGSAVTVPSNYTKE